MTFPLITDNSSFAEFCQEAMKQPYLGVDTEFVWTKTYYPNLGLLQLAYDREHCALVDTIAVTDTAPFKALLENSSVTKIFHEAGSDLPILHRWCGAIPKNIADTRIAAGFCGLTAQLSLRKLLIMQLGITLKKTETRTDWMQRPLTDAQLEYAGEDVILLPDLFRKLRSLMEAKEDYSFFVEDMKVYENPEYYREVPPEQFWEKISRPGYLKFTRQDFAVLQRLAAWREKLAREKNITKNRVMRDSCMSLAAVKHPYTADEVAKLEGMPNTPSMHYAREIADIVVSAMKLSKDEWPQMEIPNIDVRMLKQASDRIISLAQKRSTQLGIDQVLIASRREADSLATAVLTGKDYNACALMQGWRYQVFGKSIDEICKDIKKKLPR